MSDKRREEHAHDALVVPIGGGGGGHGGRVLDPRAAMPGSIKHVGGDRPAPQLGDEERAELRRKHFEFLHHLAFPAHLADVGNVPQALAATFGISLEEAEARQVELHDSLTSATRSMTMGETLRKSNASAEARVAVLGRWLHSPDPKVSIVAARVLNDMDDVSAGSKEETIEDYIVGVLDDGE